MANQIKSEFVGIVAHDLANPLWAIKGNVELLLAEGGGEISLETRETLKDILKTCERMNRLREDTLDLSRIQLYKMELQKEKADMVKLLGEFLSGQENDARKKGQVIRLQAPEHLQLEFDPIRIGQVIQNYVSNAIRYSPEDTEIEVKLVAAGEETHLIVKDSGRGIDPSELERTCSCRSTAPGAG